MVTTRQEPTAPARSLARRARFFGPSVWNDVAAIVKRNPDVIYFGSGAPARELYPLARLREAAATAWAEAGDALDYGDSAGHEPLRWLIAQRMAGQGVPGIDPDRIMVTSGSQQGIEYVAKLMTDPGDLIVVEAPTYIGAMQAFDPYEPDYLAVPVDDDGLDVGALAAMVQRAGRLPKVIYTIPTFQNPTGITMSAERRAALLAYARERDILILEDDPYGELYVAEAPPPPLVAAEPDLVVYLGTFSKTIAPGIRVGWLVAPPDLIGMLKMAKEAADIHADRMIMRTVVEAAQGFLDGHIAVARDVYRARRDALLGALEERMPPGVTWSHPGGGFFVWVTLPPGYDGERFLPFAAERGVAFLPGAYFYPKGQERWESIRINFSTLPPERIDEGIRRLGHAVVDFLALGPTNATSPAEA